MQVSVPGMYQKPAPYSEQTFTYSTALAFTGRSAACAPPTTSKPAAEPSKRPLIVFIVTLQVALWERRRPGGIEIPQATSPLAPQKTARSPRAFGQPRPDARVFSELPHGTTPDPQVVAGKYAFATSIIKIVYLIT